jgi:sugar fermentation stimulation protein A
MLYIAQRSDSDRLVFAYDLDAAYGRAVMAAAEAGVESLGYRCHVDVEEVRLGEMIRVDLPVLATA